MKINRKKYSEKFVGTTSSVCTELVDRHKKVIRILSIYKFDRVLDVGCGDGNFSKLIKDACEAKEVYGIETSKEGVELARKNGVRVFQSDINEESFPFEDDYFDAIYAGAIIEHLFDPDHFLDEIYRVLNSNGIFVLDTPNLASIYNRFALLLGYQPFDTYVSLKYPVGHLYEGTYKTDDDNTYIRGSDHIRPFTFRSLSLILKKHNFLILKIYGASDKIHTNNRLLASLVKIIDYIIVQVPPLSRNIVIVVQKGEYKNENSNY